MQRGNASAPHSKLIVANLFGVRILLFELCCVDRVSLQTTTKLTSHICHRFKSDVLANTTIGLARGVSGTGQARLVLKFIANAYQEVPTNTTVSGQIRKQTMSYLEVEKKKEIRKL